MRTIKRREFLAGAAAGGIGLGLALPAVGGVSAAVERPESPEGRAPRRSPALDPRARDLADAPAKARRRPGSRPFPAHPIGYDGLPGIDHIVVFVLENHTFDNMLGMLGRGDGFTIGSNGRPTAALPDGKGNVIHAFEMPNACQLKGAPSNSWNASHLAYNGGRNDGFARSDSSGPVAMGYYEAAQVPFISGLASTFPICDRYFCSVLGPTYPNRRFLMAGTALGLIDDSFPAGRPRAGTIFELLTKHGISWANYYSNLPSSLIWLSEGSDKGFGSHLLDIAKFYEAARTGKLPAVSLVDPNFTTQSEENPQDVQFGDRVLGEVVDAVVHGPAWERTLLVWTFDEGGGYFDHVPPPTRSRRTRCGPRSRCRRTSPGATTATASGCRPGSWPRGRSATTSPTSSTTTPRCSP